MTDTTFISRVLHILNEADSSITGAELVGADMTNIEEYIRSHYPAAFRRAVGIMPTSYFIPKPFIENIIKVTNPTDGTGYVILPTDFLRLVKFKMQPWKTDCITLQEETPEINRKQLNEYLRGTIHNPVCVWRYKVHDNILKRAMYYYSLPKAADDTNHTIETALYIADVTTLGETIDVTEQGAEPLAWILAATVLTTLEKENSAKAIESKIIELIK